MSSENSQMILFSTFFFVKLVILILRDTFELEILEIMIPDDTFYFWENTLNNQKFIRISIKSLYFFVQINC